VEWLASELIGVSFRDRGDRYGCNGIGIGQGEQYLPAAASKGDLMSSPWFTEWLHHFCSLTSSTYQDSSSFEGSPSVGRFFDGRI